MKHLDISCDDPDSELKTILHYDENEDIMVVERQQDVEKILNANKEAFNSYSPYHKRQDMYCIAEVPLVVYEDWIKQGYDVHDEVCLMRLLNDYNNRKFRTNGMRL